MTQKWIKTSYNSDIDGHVATVAEKNGRIKFSHQLVDKYIKNPERVLDIGCGTGVYLYSIQENNNCIGMDLEDEALKIAKNNCQNAKFLKGSVLKLPFEENSFDVVTLWEVIEHIPTDTEKIAVFEINRVLKKGGLLILSTPNKNIFSNALDPAYFLKGHRHYSVDELSNLIKKCNFHIKEHAIKGGFNTLFAMNLFYINKHIFHKNEGYFQNIFDNLSSKEYLIGKKKFANLFIVAEKKNI